MLWGSNLYDSSIYASARMTLSGRDNGQIPTDDMMSKFERRQIRLGDDGRQSPYRPGRWNDSFGDWQPCYPMTG
jgi:hypothetical protein